MFPLSNKGGFLDAPCSNYRSKLSSCRYNMEDFDHRSILVDSGSIVQWHCKSHPIPKPMSTYKTTIWVLDTNSQTSRIYFGKTLLCALPRQNHTLYEPKANFIRQGRPRYSFFGFCEPILCMKINFGVTFFGLVTRNNERMANFKFSTLADKD